jgi:hypothetical protein
MPNWKKFRFKIEAKIHGEEMTPLNLPMARLAEYLADLADILGHRDFVHLISVEPGSAEPNFWIEPPAYDGAIARARSAQFGNGPREANEGFKRLNQKLKEDNGSAGIFEESQTTNIIEFPGVKLGANAAIKGIREQASVAGELRRIGGLDKTIHLQIRRADGDVVYVEADEMFGKQLEGRLFTYIRVSGIATWMRDTNGKWHLEKFRAQSFDPEPLINEPFGTTMETLKSLPGNKWGEVEDPFDEWRKIRHGDEDEPIQ